MSQLAILDQRVRASPQVRSPVRTTGTRPALGMVLLLIALFIPSQASFVIGGLAFSGYRLVIILFIVPALIRVLSQRFGTAGWVDLAMLFASAWFVIATSRNDGLARALEAGGAASLDFLGTYLLARAYLTREAHVIWVARFLAMGILAIMPFMIIESLTGKHVLKDMVNVVVGGNFYIAPDKRWGFERAWGPFDHPILAGIITSTAISLVWFSIGSRKSVWVRLAWIAGPVLATVSTFSSGALASTVIQFGCIVWFYTTRSLRHRWLWLATGLLAFYLMIELVSNRSAYAVLISYLTFNPHTGFYRVEIFHWGFYHNILREPIFGIGESNWIRAAWMYSGSVDNFWLKITMDRGIPLFLMVVAAVLVALFGNRRGRVGTSEVRLGWTISMFAICFAGLTVHFWNHSFVWFALFLGIGTTWLRPVPRPQPTIAVERTRAGGLGADRRDVRMSRSRALIDRPLDGRASK